MTAGLERRKIRYETVDDLIADVQHLQQAPYQRCGQWSLAQNCEHIDKLIQGSMHGLADVRGGWLIRATVGRLMLKWVFKTERMPGGTEAPGDLRPSPTQTDDLAIIERLVASARTLATATTFVPSPFFGVLTPDEWRRLQLIHAAHHLSHLVPT